ncbi:MAG TPA: hypothetical protein DGH68_07335, partial [Bacteroidetes bacterium]|nr:hypothetical protein [Bacteroidota bacterium]
MDFIKHLALPQSMEQYHLLLFILNLTFIVLLPYLGFLLGTSLFSYIYNKKGTTEKNQLYKRFAKDLIDTGVFSKSGLAFLAIIPAASLVFLYAQLLQATTTIAVSVMTFGFLALLAGSILLYAYKYTFKLSSVLTNVESYVTRGSAAREEVADYLQTTEHTHLRCGRYGIGFLFVGSFLTVGASAMACNPATWSTMDNVFELFLSLDFLARYLQFLAIGLGVTGIGILFFLITWQSGERRPEESYASLIRQFGFRWSAVSFLLQPVLLVLTLAVLPAGAASGLMYALGGTALLFLFAAAHFVYAFKRDGQVSYTAYAFFTLALALTLIFTKDQVAIGNGTKEHAARLSLAYEKDVEELKARLGVAAKALTGQEIYDAKCSACHLFDQKKVGPPYKETIPKYAGKKTELIAFIMSPIKINPAYPNMPNQG